MAAGHCGDRRAVDAVAHLIDARPSAEVFPRRGTRRDDPDRGLRVMGHRRLASVAFTVGRDVVAMRGNRRRGRDLGAGLFTGR